MIPTAAMEFWLSQFGMPGADFESILAAMGVPAHGETKCHFCEELIELNGTYATVGQLGAYCHVPCLTTKLKEDPDWGRKPKYEGDAALHGP